MILEDNTFVDVVLPSSVLRDLTDERCMGTVVRTRTTARTDARRSRVRATISFREIPVARSGRLSPSGSKGSCKKAATVWVHGAKHPGSAADAPERRWSRHCFPPGRTAAISPIPSCASRGPRVPPPRSTGPDGPRRPSSTRSSSSTWRPGSRRRGRPIRTVIPSRASSSGICVIALQIVLRIRS
jgi:hypothetical protein